MCLAGERRLGVERRVRRRQQAGHTVQACRIRRLVFVDVEACAADRPAPKCVEQVVEYDERAP